MQKEIDEIKELLDKLNNKYNYAYNTYLKAKTYDQLMQENTELWSENEFLKKENQRLKKILDYTE